jgi:hypothetical protein
MYVLKAVEKPNYASKNSDDFFFRDRGRKDCEGMDNATKFASYDDAKKVANTEYQVIEVEIEV